MAKGKAPKTGATNQLLTVNVAPDGSMGKKQEGEPAAFTIGVSGIQFKIGTIIACFLWMGTT